MSGTSSGVAISKSGGDVNLQIFRGKTLNFDLVWGGDTPIDITGYQAKMQARSLDGTMLLELDTSSGGITIDGPLGKLTFKASPALTGQISKPGRYEVELTSAGGDIYRAISGSISPVEDMVF